MPNSCYLLTSLLLLLTGCATTFKAPQVDFSVLKPPGPVVTVVAAWEPAVSNGEKPQRGFGGRVYLYDQERPVKAKGTIVVYIFDEEGRMPGDERPNEGIVFSEKILNSKGVYKKSKIGHSYNLWIPIDATGPEGQAKKISLIVRYIPEKGGSEITSTQATALLPGRNSGGTKMAQSERQGHTESGVIQQTSAEHWKAERSRLKEERLIESVDHPQLLQAVTIR